MMLKPINEILKREGDHWSGHARDRVFILAHIRKPHQVGLVMSMPDKGTGVLLLSYENLPIIWHGKPDGCD